MSLKRPEDCKDPAVNKRCKLDTLEHVGLNCQLNSLKDDFREAWNQKQCFARDGASLNQYPFTHCVLSDFVQDEQFLDDLQAELFAISFQEKNNDLYKFKQSSDLKYKSSPCIAHLRHLLCGEFRSWLGDVTSIPFTTTVDTFCSQYKYTDVLLCHDDELEGRRIAFILYLVQESWENADGGMLDLFDMDENGQPNNVVKSVCPKRNNMLFFEVTEASFHQVAEILSEDKCRVSVSGWFHVPVISRSKPYVELPSPMVQPRTIDEDELYSWINPIYLNPEIQADIKEKFENDSEIELKDFLQEDKYKAVLEVLNDPQVTWTKRGPANKRNYNTVSGSQPDLLVKCIEFLQSDAMFLILSNLTGLKLHELGPSSDEEDGNTSNGPSKQSRDGVANPRCRTEVRLWEHGSYSLIHDTDSESSEYALDSFMYFGCPDWDAENGGYTTYIANGEDEELLTVCPADNSFALVYRDQETLRFVKHLNHTITKVSEPKLYDIATIYYE